MKPLKVLFYKGQVQAMKAQSETPQTELATLISTNYYAGDEVGCIIFEATGVIGYWPLSYLEVLPGQFDSEVVISVDVPGAINNALNPDSL